MGQLHKKEGCLNVQQQLELPLSYGMYAEVLSKFGNEKEILPEWFKSHLYKDILVMGGIRKPGLLEKLVQALAFQRGSEVSYHELSKLLVIDKDMVSKHIDLLTEALVVFKLPSFNKNPHSEIKTSRNSISTITVFIIRC